MSTIARDLARVAPVTLSTPAPHTKPHPAAGALARAARALSRRGRYAAKAELCNAALARLVELCFELDTDGIRANVDWDGRILIPLPWGRAGYKLWSLRITEQRILNRLMRRRSEGEKAPLFRYDATRRLWLLNLDYDQAQAARYLARRPLSAAEWRAARDSLRLD